MNKSKGVKMPKGEKYCKRSRQSELCEIDGDDQTSSAICTIEDNKMTTGNTSLDFILNELREYSGKIIVWS